MDSSARSVSGLCIAVSELPAPLEPTLPRENWRSLLALGAVVLSGPISGLEGRLSVDLPFASTLAPPLPLLDPFFLTRSAQLIPFGGIVDGREGARKQVEIELLS